MASSLTVYIPIDRRVAIAAGRELPERTQGAALFADISGFTPLTEMLARRLGPRRGAEQLTVYLNRVYEALISELHRYGGSVIGFSGDAITCWFDGDPGERAVAAALAMQQAMRQFADLPVEGGMRVSLAMKAAVVTGSVRRFVVGEPGYTLVDVIAGETLERLSAAERLAEKGEVILDSATVRRLGERVQTGEWRLEGEYALVSGLNGWPEDAPWPALPDDAISESIIRGWLLTAVYERLRSGGGDFLAEIRPAAALFVRFSGFDYDQEEDAARRLNHFICHVEEILARTEGSLIQLTLGDKGSYLYAAFGAPIAHEDDVDRAAMAALALQALPGELGFLDPLQIGITYGRMRAGAYGAVLRRTYGVLGDAVNLAARLMQVAQPGQILVSEEAYVRASSGQFVWEQVPSVRVKGKSEPVTLYRLVRAIRRQDGLWLDALFPSPPVGRQEISARLNACLEELLDGKGGVIRLSGEPGMGKSHLTAYFTRFARHRGVRVAVGACHSITHNTPYSPWRRIFSYLLQLDEVNDEDRADHLTGFITQSHPDWALRLPLLGDLLALPIPDNPTTQAMDSNMRQKSLFSLLNEMIQTWARQDPLLLIIEDGEWMDEASRALLLALAQQTVSAAPVLLLVVHRSAGIGSQVLLPELERLPHSTTLKLTEMPREEILALIRQRLAAPPSPLLAELVTLMGRGNPFFTAELLDSLRKDSKLSRREDGLWDVSPELLRVLQRESLIVQEGGEWRLKTQSALVTTSLGVPDSIHELILSRLDHLPEAQRLTLKVSSVIGQIIRLAMLAKVHPEQKPVDAIKSEAEYLESEGIFHAEEPQQEIYTFTHPTTQEVIYETLLFQQRRQIHQAVAQTLARDVPEATTEIANHAYLGEVWHLALEYNLKAGNQAKQLHANQQSIDFYQKALHSAQQLPEASTRDSRKQIHLALGDLLISAGQYTTAEEHLNQALQLAQLTQDWEAEARCCRWFGRSYETRGEFSRALEWLDKGFAALEGHLSVEEAELSLIAGLIHVRQANYDRAVALCRRSLEVARLLQDETIEARTYSLMGIIDLRGQGDAAIELGNQSLRLYEKLGNVYGQANAHNLIANGYFALGQLSNAAHHYRQALDMFTQIGNIYNQVLVNNNLGGIALKQGRLDASLGYYQRAFRDLEQIGGSIWVFGALRMNIAAAHIRRKEIDLAQEQLALAQFMFAQSEVRDLLPELYGLFAEAHLLWGDLPVAEQYGQQSVELARELNMPREEAHNLRILGEIALARSQYSQAHDFLSSSRQILEDVADEYELAKTQLSFARLFAAQERWEQCREALGLCEPVFVRLEAQLDLQEVESLIQKVPG